MNLLERFLSDALMMLLFRRLSQRPTVEELEQRNILQGEMTPPSYSVLYLLRLSSVNF